MTNTNELKGELLFNQEVKLINDHIEEYFKILDNLINTDPDSEILKKRRTVRKICGITVSKLLKTNKLDSKNSSDFMKYLETLSYTISEDGIMNIYIGNSLLDEINIGDTENITDIGLYGDREVTNDEMGCIGDSENDRQSCLLKIIIKRKSGSTKITLNEHLILGFYFNFKVKNNISDLGDTIKKSCNKLLP